VVDRTGRHFKNEQDRRALEPIVHITPRALQALHEMVNAEEIDPSTIYVRLEINEEGCSLYLDPEANEDDLRLSIDGLTVLVDSDTGDNYRGAEIDFVNENNRQGFTVNT
jgi:Fe-S cluster assembly iron-binding protein IscA